MPVYLYGSKGTEFLVIGIEGSEEGDFNLLINPGMKHIALPSRRSSLSSVPLFSFPKNVNSVS